MVQFYYNPQDHIANEGRPEAIEAGWYKMVITETSYNQTKGKDGYMLTAKFQVIEGPHSGSVVYHNFNTVNKNPQAEQIGNGQIRHLCDLFGIAQAFQDSEILHNKPLMCYVVKDSSQQQFAPTNNITKWKPANYIPDGTQGGFETPPAFPPGNAPMPPAYPPQPPAYQPPQQPPAYQPPQQPAYPPQNVPTYPPQPGQPPTPPQPGQPPTPPQPIPGHPTINRPTNAAPPQPTTATVPAGTNAPWLQNQ